MASEALFDRKYKLLIGPEGGLGKEWKGERNAATEEWEGLRLSFKFEKNGDASPNKGDVTIYNLSSESREFIKKKQVLRLEAGYASGIKLIGLGQVELVDHERQGPDWVTKIHLADGVRAYRSVVLSESFGPKTTEESVIKSIAEKMGVTLGTMKLHPTPKGLPKGAPKPKHMFNQGRQLSGPASKALDALCRSRSLRWSIQDGVMHILPTRESMDLEAYLLSPATGLIGSPRRTEKGVKLKSLLLGGINPGRLIKLESDLIKGVFVAEYVVHAGDTHGQDWYSDFECIQLS